MAHRAPREEQVRQLLERRSPLGDHLQLVAIVLERVEGLDQQAATDPLEVEVADPHLRFAGFVWRDLDDLEALLGPEHLERLRRVARRDDGLEEAGPDGARGRLVDHPVDTDDPAVGRYRVALQGSPERFRQVDDTGEPAGIAVLDDADGGRLEVRCDLPGGVEVEQVVEREVLAGDLVRSGDRGLARGRIRVEGAKLMRVLAVAQV